MKTNKLTPKKSKPVITPYSCMCNTTDCILKDNKTYREYASSTRHCYEILGLNPNPARSDLTDGSYNMSLSKVEFRDNPVNFTKCRVAKEYLKALIALDHTFEANKELAEQVDLLAQPMVQLRKTNKNLVEISLKCHKELIEQKAINNKITAENTTRKENEKAQKAQIKELKRMMSKMTFNEIKTVEHSSDEDLSDEEPEPTEEQTEPVKPITCIEPIKLNLIQTYEKVKNYMVKNACSIGCIAKRMNYNQSNILKVCESFINLRRLRNIEAHPNTVDIIDDTEFLTLLELY